MDMDWQKILEQTTTHSMEFRVVAPSGVATTTHPGTSASSIFSADLYHSGFAISVAKQQSAMAHLFIGFINSLTKLLKSTRFRYFDVAVHLDVAVIFDI